MTNHRPSPSPFDAAPHDLSLASIVPDQLPKPAALHRGGHDNPSEYRFYAPAFLENSHRQQHVPRERCFRGLVMEGSLSYRSIVFGGFLWDLGHV